MSLRKFLPCFTFLCLAFFSCKNENPQVKTFDQKLLQGRWEIREAWRNGKPTETLTGTFYQFDGQGKMRTNLNPNLAEEEYDFEVSDNLIRQGKGEVQVLYTIEQLTDSALVLSLDFRNIPFRLSLFKTTPPEPGQDEIIQ